MKMAESFERLENRCIFGTFVEIQLQVKGLMLGKKIGL